jgi:hypothetical protein
MYEVLNDDPERGQRFAHAMSLHARSPLFAVEHLSSSYDWAALGSSTVVDVSRNVVRISGGPSEIDADGNGLDRWLTRHDCAASDCKVPSIEDNRPRSRAGHPTGNIRQRNRFSVE